MNKSDLYKIINPDSDYNENNLRFQEMLFMINASQIPYSAIGKKLVPDDIDLRQFEKLSDIQQDILNFVNSGKQMYLYSETCGNGKTTWSIKLLLQYFNEKWACNCFKERGLFINVPTFLTKLKSSISLNDAEFDILKSKITLVDFVVWDDIAATKLSDYDYNNLLSYIDKRTLESKSNLYTGNIKPNKLSDYVGDRLASRILGNSEIIALYGKDNRQKED